MFRHSQFVNKTKGNAAVHYCQIEKQKQVVVD